MQLHMESPKNLFSEFTGQYNPIHKTQIPQF